MLNLFFEEIKDSSTKNELNGEMYNMRNISIFPFTSTTISNKVTIRIQKESIEEINKCKLGTRNTKRQKNSSHSTISQPQ